MKMAEESAKTYVFGSDANNSMLPWLAAGNSGFGGFGGWGGGILGFLLGALFSGIWGGNGFGFGNNGFGGAGYVANALNNDAGRDLIMQGIQGNATAISQLASTLNTDFATVQTALNTINSSVASVGAQVGMSGLEVVNAIQSGNAALASQFAQCCCENKLLVTSQGYESRIATLEQTNALGSQADRNTRAITDAIAAQTTLITKEFCDVKERELQDKINTLTAMNSTLRGQIDNANQTAAIEAYVGSVVAPIKADVESIKANQPATVTIPYSPVTPVPTALMYGAGYGSYGIYGNGYWN